MTDNIPGHHSFGSTTQEQGGGFPETHVDTVTQTVQVSPVPMADAFTQPAAPENPKPEPVAPVVEEAHE